MFFALAAGTVPVYPGAPNVTDYVPKDCFVDYRDYPSLDDLVVRMKQMTQSGEWETCRERGWEFLKSPMFEPFSLDRFAETTLQALCAVAR